MIDFELASAADLEKHKNHFPSGSDLTLQALKGHLLVEELLREVFIIQLAHPKALKGEKGASFDCHQIICLTEAITLHSNIEPWLWVAAKKLNNLRNDLAHQLTPKSLKQKIDDLVKYVLSKNPEAKRDIQSLGLSEDYDFEFTIMAMCACLSSLKAVLLDRKNKLGT